MPAPNLAGRVCLVTGGSRGIGRGIALQLGQSGALVYVTGRSKAELESCCQEIKRRGGQGVPVIVDHSKDDEVEKLFERIKKEQNGKLDVLVNNAYAAVNTITDNLGKPFWETPAAETWDSINNVGLRNHYICTVFASRLMVPRKSGLIVNISSGGGLKYLFNVAYGVGKAGCDRMAADCAFELRRHNVAVVSLWPGPVKTEKIVALMEKPDAPTQTRQMFSEGESQEFSGKAVAHLAADQGVMSKSGRVLMTADLAREFGFVDEDGTIPGDMRSLQFILKLGGWNRLAEWTPRFVRVPHTLMYYSAYKF